MGNSFGDRFRLTTFGESHGEAVGGIVDGCPAGITIDYDLLVEEMKRRHYGAASTARCEEDTVELLSGVYGSKTLGTPIAFVIRNKDVRSEDYDRLESLMRPGHGDYTWFRRYGLRDHRGGGRCSGRETAARVAGGAIAKMLLHTKGIEVHAEVAECGTPDADDSCGGIIAATISGLPAGYGNPVFGKLNARLAAAVMSIPSATGFETGAGFAAARMKGSEFRDLWNADFSTKSNHCGGIQGGISNGMPITFRAAFHPAVTIGKETECITEDGTLETITPSGRHDRCHIPRTVVVVEAMAALTVADFVC